MRYFLYRVSYKSCNKNTHSTTQYVRQTYDNFRNSPCLEKISQCRRYISYIGHDFSIRRNPPI